MAMMNMENTKNWGDKAVNALEDRIAKKESRLEDAKVFRENE